MTILQSHTCLVSGLRRTRAAREIYLVAVVAIGESARVPGLTIHPVRHGHGRLRKEVETGGQPPLETISVLHGSTLHMETLCWKCENLIARHGAAAHDLSEVAVALTQQAKTDCNAAEREAALARVIVAEAQCAGIRAMISAHLLEHTGTQTPPQRSLRNKVSPTQMDPLPRRFST